MADIAELERRVTALEAESRAGRRDSLRMLGLQADTLDQLDALNRRVAANELTATANARTTEAGFANVQTQISALDAKIEGVQTGLAKVEGDVAALRRDLPGMLVEAIRAARDA